jgi:uncharacterized protein YjiS (DUF1127 family)
MRIDQGGIGRGCAGIARRARQSHSDVSASRRTERPNVSIISGDWGGFPDAGRQDRITSWLQMKREFRRNEIGPIRRLSRFLSTARDTGRRRGGRLGAVRRRLTMATTSAETFRRSYGPARTVGMIGAALAAVLLWHERGRQRRHLAGLNDRMLRDLGLTRTDVERECGKPVWRI